jgi:hypothetical protein
MVPSNDSLNYSGICNPYHNDDQWPTSGLQINLFAPRTTISASPLQRFQLLPLRRRRAYARDNQSRGAIPLLPHDHILRPQKTIVYHKESNSHATTPALPINRFPPQPERHCSSCGIHFQSPISKHLNDPLKLLPRKSHNANASVLACQ